MNSDIRATVVLVHGAFVDGSGWAGVHRRLRDDGYPVMAARAGANVRAVPGSHAVFIANPQVVVSLIEEAARGGSA